MQARNAIGHPKPVAVGREIAYPSPSPRQRRWIIAIVVTVTAAAITATGLLTRDGTKSRSEAPLGGITAVLPGSGSIGQARLDRIVGWVDGIVAGRILATDVAARVWSAYPSDTMRVQAASTAVRSLAPARRASAMSWVRGLADGSIVWSDVNSRLLHQDPKLAEVVRDAWFVIQGLHPANYH
jgi:hypothetical protein